MPYINLNCVKYFDRVHIWNLLLEHHNAVKFLLAMQSLDLSPMMPQFWFKLPVALPAGFEWRCSFVLGFDSLMTPEFYLYFVQLSQPSLSIFHWISTFLNTFLFEISKSNTLGQYWYIFLYIFMQFPAQWFNENYLLFHQTITILYGSQWIKIHISENHNGI